MRAHGAFARPVTTVEVFMSSFLLRAAPLAFAVALAGCATVPPDAGRVEVEALVGTRLGVPGKLSGGDAATADAPTRELLVRPLTPDAAVQVALLNNPTLQARLAGLGVNAAEVVQAQRLPNPRFAFGNKRNAEIATIDRALMVSVLALVTMPLAIEASQRQYDAAKLGAAGDVARLAHDTRRAWYAAVAAQESVRYFERVLVAADAARDLAQRMEAAGNFSALAKMREESFAAEASARLAEARLAATLERERLARLLGLDEGRPFTLPERLPDPPAQPLAAGAADEAVVDERLDVLAAKREAEAVAVRLGLTRATRFVNVLEAGYINESHTGEPRQNGYEIVLEVPLFDWGDARLARGEAEYLQSVARLRATALAARSELRASYAAYRTRHTLARHYRDDVVPLRQRIADESLLRYNAMLIGVFELLAEARLQIASVTAAIDASRDFWIADADLAMARSGTSFAAGEPVRAVTAAAPRTTGGH